MDSKCNAGWRRTDTTKAAVRMGVGDRGDANRRDLGTNEIGRNALGSDPIGLAKHGGFEVRHAT